MNYIKSPLNYVGGKYKLLPQIIPLFPEKIHTFIDLFGGGANVAININADTVIYNDINLKVVQILETFKNNDTDILLAEIEKLIYHYNLSKINKEGFLRLRDSYNKSNEKNPIKLYTIICYAFNNQIRFNSSGEFNMPFGKDRSSFNPVLRNKFIEFCEALHNKNILFTNSDFREYIDLDYVTNDFVYCDPPYFNSTACYNEAGGWDNQDETDLICFLNYLTSKNIRWALSNNLSTNPTLRNFADRYGYKIHYLNADYSNCNYHKKNKDKTETQEVLITNY